MNTRAGKCSFKYVTGHHVVWLSERSKHDDNVLFDLAVGGRKVGELSFLEFTLRGVAVGQATVLIWGGTNVYTVDLSSAQLSHHDMGEPVDTAYSLGPHWVLVCETSVRLFNPTDGHVVDDFQHNEIVVASWWRDSELVVEDFEGVRLEFEPSEADRSLRYRGRNRA